MRQLKRILVGHDLGVDGEVALTSALALANRCRATLRLVHVVEPLDAYQRISHPLTSPFTVAEIAQKAAAAQSRYELWPWLLALGAALLLAEMFFVHWLCPRVNPTVAESMVPRQGIFTVRTAETVA